MSSVQVEGAERYPSDVARGVNTSLTIDMLCPLGLNNGRTTSWLKNAASFSVDDYRKIRASGIKVFHISYGRNKVRPYEDVLGYLAAWNGVIASNGDYLARIDEPDDFDRIVASERIGIILGTQSAYHLQSVDDVEIFYALGQRVCQLTYNTLTPLGSGCTERVDCGLSDLGVAMVERMNEVGMTVDLSHCGDRTTMDAIEASKGPVLITHANCRALVPGHPRGKTDEAILALARKGGVIGMTILRNFVSEQEPTTIEHWLDHCEHVIKLVGVEHVGIGSDTDLDGWDRLDPLTRGRIIDGMGPKYRFRERLDIEGLDHPQRTFDIVAGMRRRGYGFGDIGLILGGNFARVLAETWR